MVLGTSLFKHHHHISPALFSFQKLRSSLFRRQMSLSTKSKSSLEWLARKHFFTWVWELFTLTSSRSDIAKTYHVRLKDFIWSLAKAAATAELRSLLKGHFKYLRSVSNQPGCEPEIWIKVIENFGLATLLRLDRTGGTCGRAATALCSVHARLESWDGL